MSEKKQYSSTSVARAIDVLSIFRDSTGSMSLLDVAAMTGFLKPSAFRILKVLCAEGLLFKEPASGRYRLSYRVISLSEFAKANGGLAAEARAVMHELNVRLKETIFLSVRDGDYRIDIQKFEGKNHQRSIITLDVHKPLYRGAPSMLIAAAMSDAELVEMLKRTAPADFAVKPFLREINVVRKNGFSESRVTGGSLSAPILDRSNKLIGALTVSAPLSEFSEVRENLKASVLEAASELSKTLSRK